MKPTFSRSTLKFMFTLYVMGLLYLLFVSGRHFDLSWMVRGGFERLFDEMKHQLNLIPFRSILGYLAQMNWSTGMTSILKNIVGHMVAFSGLGYFLPRLWPKYLKRKTFVLHVLLAFILIEVLQYFTMSGALDIDDIALNVLGATLGFVFLRRQSDNTEETHG